MIYKLKRKKKLSDKKVKSHTFPAPDIDLNLFSQRVELDLTSELPRKIFQKQIIGRR